MRNVCPVYRYSSRLLTLGDGTIVNLCVFRCNLNRILRLHNSQSNKAKREPTMCTFKGMYRACFQKNCQNSIDRNKCGYTFWDGVQWFDEDIGHQHPISSYAIIGEWMTITFSVSGVICQIKTKRDSTLYYLPCSILSFCTPSIGY